MTRTTVEPAPEFAGRSPSVVLVLIDQLRADQLGIHGSPDGLTPNLDRLAREGFYFERARSAAPWTFPSVASLLTGLYPSAHGAGREQFPDKPAQHWINPLSVEVTTLAEYAKRRGYATAGFVTNPYLKPAGGLAQGFDHWEHDFVKSWATDPRDDNRQWWMESSYAHSVNPRVTDWVRSSSPGPLFAYVHYIDVHGPWDYAPWRSDFSTPARNDREEYKRAIAYIDRQIGELFAELNTILSGDMLFVVTSDHGCHLEIQDVDSPFKKSKASLHDFNLHVPLILAGTEALPFRGARTLNVSLVDVLPTFLAVFGLQPDHAIDGRSLFPLMRGSVSDDGRPIYAEVDDTWRSWAQIAGPLKRIRTERPTPALFEYKWLEIATESPSPLVAPTVRQQQIFREMQESFDEMLSRSPAAQSEELDAATVERLRSLGYLQ